MEFETISAKLVGTPGEGGWSQIHEFKPEDRDKLNARGEIFAVVSTERYEEGVDSVVAGRELVTRLHEEYYGSLEGGAFEALERSVEKVTGEFKKSWGDVEIAAVSLVGEVAYFAASGGAKVQILRGENFADILTSTSEAVATASGYPKVADVIVVSTDVFRDIGDDKLKKALSGKGLDEVVEELAPGVHSRQNQGRMAAVIVKFRDKREIEPISTVRDEVPKVEGKPTKRKSFNVKSWVAERASSLSKVLPERRIYIREGTKDLEETQRKKTSISIGIVILVLLSVSIFFGIRQKRVNEEKSEYESRLMEARHQLEEATEIYSLNPQRARELFVQSQETAGVLADKGMNEGKLASLIEDQKKAKGDILGDWEAEPKLFVDLSLLASDFTGEALAYSDGDIFILDRAGSRVASINSDTKRSEVVAGPDAAEDAEAIAAYSDSIYLLTDEGIDEVNEGKDRVVEKSWQDDSLIHAFAGNLYVLDKRDYEILRFARLDEGFSSGSFWIAEGVKRDFSDVLSWTIDGNIWILKEGAEVLRFSLGNKVNFSLSGIFPEMESAADIYADAETESLYLLDNVRGRVVVVDKEGGFRAQYLSDEIKQAIALVVSEELRKIIVLKENKLLLIEAKHLD
ncbi:MAG: hypothetical protein PVJ52_02570 [Candidatus Woesebacteria bacterium]|jgi:alpha/beta superfamily hydrolase/galactitol-specific phosphotransferase system IIB component